MTPLWQLIQPDGAGAQDPFLAQFSSCPRCQYWLCSHASHSQLMLRTVLIPARTPTSIVLRILHLVLDGSISWVVGITVTSNCNIFLLDGCYIALQSHKGGSLRLSLSEQNHHLHPSLYLLLAPHRKTSSSSSFSSHHSPSSGSDRARTLLQPTSNQDA